MNREQAVLNAVMVLGKNAEYFRNKGWKEHTQENEQAVKQLQASVAESRALDESSVSELIHAATLFLKRFTAIRL